MSDQPQALLVVRTDVDPEHEQEFNRWYDEVHLREIVNVPGVRSGRRYRLAEGDDVIPGEGVQRYLAVYELEDRDVVHTPEFADARGWGPLRPHVANNKGALYVLLTSHGD